MLLEVSEAKRQFSANIPDFRKEFAVHIKIAHNK